MGRFGRRVWRLVAFSRLLTCIGQGLYTYYYDYLHAALGTIWPSDVLVFFWIVPAMTKSTGREARQALFPRRSSFTSTRLA